MTARGTQTLTWDVENRPVTIVDGANTTTFVYDGEGKRGKKTEAGETVLYVNRYYEKNLTTGVVTAYYFFGDKLVAQRTGASLKYIHLDHLGGTSMVSDDPFNQNWNIRNRCPSREGHYDRIGERVNSRNADEFVRLYRQHSIRHRDSFENGDYRNANRAYDGLKQLLGRLFNDDLLAEQVLPRLLKDEDPLVRAWAASHSLGLKRHIEEAENVLAEISRGSPSMLRFGAQKTLEVWNKQGYLKF